MKIFISYRRGDSKYVVDRIRDRLIVAYGAESVFRDIESIPLGKDFSTVLNNETGSCDVMLVIIGPLWAAITDAQGHKRLFDPGDYTRIEIETGLNRKDVLVIPVMVMNAAFPTPQDMPESLGDLMFRNAINVRNDPDFDNDIKRLILGINQTIGGTVDSMAIAHYEPETVFIPQGSFWMGSVPETGIPGYESPQHEITLPDYRIGKYPVTNAQYEAFVGETKRPVAPVMGWDGQRVSLGMENYPVVAVSWFEALAYCEWLGKSTGRKYSLPNEAQWEKACRGDNKSLYPWGDEFDPTRCNHGRDQISAVDAYPAQSEYGCFDLVGNVRQWTCSLWGEKRIMPDLKFGYPWKDDRRNDLTANSQIRRVVRGSSFKDDLTLLRCSVRSGQIPGDVGLVGVRHSFRVVMIV